MRCITATCPAGPPKLSIATRSQTQNASRSDTPCCSACRPSPIESSATSRLFHARGWPIVRLGLKTAAPGVERVVNHHAVLQHLVIIGKICRKPKRDCEQAAALRRQIVARGVGAADDRGKVVERRIGDTEDAQERVERAAFALMGE